MLVIQAAASTFISYSSNMITGGHQQHTMTMTMLQMTTQHNTPILRFAKTNEKQCGIVKQITIFNANFWITVLFVIYFRDRRHIQIQFFLICLVLLVASINSKHIICRKCCKMENEHVQLYRDKTKTNIRKFIRNIRPPS